LKALLRIQEGFTLIELLAVMAIVATLAGIVATQVSGTGDTSKDVQTKTDAGTVGTAVADYFSDRTDVAIKTPQSVTVFDEAGIVITTNSKWPEIPITALTAYRTVFQETRSEVGAIAFFDEEGEPSVLSVRGLLGSYNAVDFSVLIEDGYLQSLPDGVDKFTKSFSNYLWLMKKETASSAGGTVSSREIEVFKLVTVEVVPDSDVNILAYLRLVGETIENEIPVANTPQTVKTGLTTDVEITLSGSDADGDPLTFVVVVEPEFGSVSDVSGTPPRLTYTPPGFEVTDTFAFIAFDGTSDSVPAFASIEVTPGGTTLDPPANFTDVAPSNKIDDDLDVEIALSPSSSFDVVVIFTSGFLDIDEDEATLGASIGNLVGAPSGVLVTAITPAIDAASMTMTGSQINTLAEFASVIRIEDDTEFSFTPLGG
jgi:prepilin-type N-terminal cleavage/methylation domain-containing protein